MSGKRCSACQRELPDGYIFTMRHERYDPKRDLCQRCRLARSAEYRAKEAADARGKR